MSKPVTGSFCGAGTGRPPGRPAVRLVPGVSYPASLPAELVFHFPSKPCIGFLTRSSDLYPTVSGVTEKVKRGRS